MNFDLSDVKKSLLNDAFKQFDGNLYSEKSIAGAGSGVITLKFSKNVNKGFIKSVCEDILGVEVVSVNTANVKGKRRVFKGVLGKKSSFKKAFVRVSSKDAEKIVGAS